MYLDVTGTARACLESGVRAFISRNVVDADGEAGLKRRLAELEEMYKLYNGREGRINVLASAHAEYTCSENALREVISRAKSWGSPFYIHASETVAEVQSGTASRPLNGLRAWACLKAP